MKAVVVSHGVVNDFDLAKKVMCDADMIVCADGGAEYVAKCNLTPTALIGDLDSIDGSILKAIESSGCSIVKYPREKDYTDTQLAIDYAVEKGADEIVLIGSIGDRLDHSIANILLLVKLLRMGIKAYVINEKNTIYVIDKSIKLKGKKGDLLSLIPIGGDVHGIRTEGLQYKLSGQGIPLGEPLGISNVFTCEEAEVKIESGLLLVIRAED